MRLVNKLIPSIAFFPNAILIRALQDQWKRSTWRDEYMKLPRSAILTEIRGGIPQSLTGVTMYVIG
jgi:hypothetical protein